MGRTQRQTPGPKPVSETMITIRVTRDTARQWEAAHGEYRILGWVPDSLYEWLTGCLLAGVEAYKKKVANRKEAR